MVLFKRKAVIYPDPPPLPQDLDVDVWYISQTGEWFLDYDDYLERLDYYNTRKFVCEITGNSCLTYFEAYKSEISEIESLEQNFPENLKEPILRKIQFSTIARIDQLVDHVYTVFKNDYYPGEEVYLRNAKDFKGTGGKIKCIIREKTRFNGLQQPDGTVKPSYAKYRVVIADDPTHSMVCDEDQIARDRNHFTKWFVKTFIKLSVTKSPKIGAPWVVKKKYAERYRIPTELPPEFAQFKETEETEKKKAKPLAIRPKTDPTGISSFKLISSKAGSPLKSKPTQTGSKKQNLPKLLPKRDQTPTPQPGSQGQLQLQREVQTPAPPPVPQPTIKDDFEYPLQFQPRKPQAHITSQLGPHTAKALSLWTFLNIYRSPLVLDTFTFDDFLTALSWTSASTRCSLLDEIFCGVLSAFMKEGGEKQGVQLPEEFERIEDWGEMMRKFKEGVKKGANLKKDIDLIEEHDDEDDVKKENGEDEEDEEEPEEDEEFNYEAKDKVEEYLSYRNIHWTTRLSKRQFKEGNWQVVLLGLLDELRHYKPFSESVAEISQILAPLDAPVSPNSIQNQFFKKLSIDLRLRALEMLTTVLVNTPLIRSFIEATMDQSAQLRRERLEIIRDYKTLYEKAQDADKECRILLDKAQSEAAGTPAVNGEKEAEENAKKRRRTGLKVAASEEETKLAETNQAFKELLDARTKYLQEAEDFRTKRKALEKTLNEIDIQRIVCLGRDRYYNKYWWFENNGLPSVKGKRSKRSSEDDEDGEGMDEDDDDEDESDDEVVEDETYLMGRLWVQGPSEDDAVFGLSLKEEDIEEWKDAENFEEQVDAEDFVDADEDESPIKRYVVVPETEEFFKQAESLYQIKFNKENHEVTNTTNDEIILDTTGATNINVTVPPITRKLIEESPSLLLKPTQWRYYETASEFDDLLKWLNPWGKRESTLYTALNEVKDQVTQSFIARRRALKVEALKKEEAELTKKIAETVISETEESEPESDDPIEISDGDDEELREDQRRTRRSIAQSQALETKRRLKEEQLQQKAAKSKPSARIQRRENRKKQRLAHEEKRVEKDEWELKLKSLKTGNLVERCLGWVNSSALEKLGHSHYDGGVVSSSRSNGRSGGRRSGRR